MAKHHPDLVFCRKQPGIALGRLCEKHDGVCVICDSYVRPHVIAHICDECNYGSFEVSIIIIVLSMSRSIIQSNIFTLCFLFIRADALFVGHLVSLMHTTVESVRCKKKM
jgi:hypothetical protein